MDGVGEGGGTGEVGPLSLGLEVRKLAEDFIAVITVQGYSLHTIGTYRKYIEDFISFITADGKDPLQVDRKASDSVDYASLLRWMQSIRLRGVKETSLSANRAAVSSWFKWLIRIGKIERNPIELMPGIKVPETDPKPMALPDTLKVLDSAPSLKWDRGNAERNRAILETFYASGIRSGELCNLDILDLKLDDDRPYLIVRAGKGKRDGVGRLTPEAVSALKDYIKVRSRIIRRWEKPRDYPPLFLSYRGERLDRTRIWQVVSQAGKMALGKHIHPHQFRHSFCTDLLNEGADLESIRKLARHKRLETTQKYLSVSTEHLNEAYKKLPRRDKRNKKENQDSGE